jgi:hypothetical protein
MMIIYIVEDDVVGGYAIGCDEEEVFWGGCRVDVADLALGKQLEIGEVRIDQGSGHKFEIFCNRDVISFLALTRRGSG